MFMLLQNQQTNRTYKQLCTFSQVNVSETFKEFFKTCFMSYYEMYLQATKCLFNNLSKKFKDEAK